MRHRCLAAALQKSSRRWPESQAMPQAAPSAY
jgi:hypothetical protein